LSQVPANIVILDTPYRFQKLLEECAGELPRGRELFLAWEIGSASELYFWGDASALKKFATERNLTKGEFILIVNSADK
jgi:16S rRNA C1402 (ribose-2'-O) methylase RsmI